MLFLIVICGMYGIHELKMTGRIMRAIRVEKKVDGIFRGIRTVETSITLVLFK